MTPQIIGPEAETRLDWIALTDAMAAGHRLPPPRSRTVSSIAAMIRC